MGMGENDLHTIAAMNAEIDFIKDILSKREHVKA